MLKKVKNTIQLPFQKHTYKQFITRFKTLQIEILLQKSVFEFSKLFLPKLAKCYYYVLLKNKLKTISKHENMRKC